ncbi:efflux RND transporter permease subunit [Pseudoalteromonas piscicida]|uniref:efflux RND transporter permease subunit n=1 Tax=Pseudoalteromonas piscicida TaxID=43662 RepID=UPI00273A5587|nr:efflux RND transporter permease subunit [Pseudoalteromonas piscicida]MDP4487348.1 efflux RND transporter permease subunit [Pseudoalteromonas piscicida]
MDKLLPSNYLTPRLVLGLTLLLVFTGIVGWFEAKSQEDPSFPYRNGFIQIVNPSASVTQLNDVVVKPLERRLAKIDEINTIHARIKAGSAVIDIELKEQVYDTALVWQRIKDEVAPLDASLADSQFYVVDRAQDTQGIVLTVHTGKGLTADRKLALKVRDELEYLDVVRSASLVGDPGLELAIFYSQERMLAFGLSPAEIAKQLQDANQQDNLGVLSQNQSALSLLSVNHLRNDAQLKNVQITTPEGSKIPLSAIADIGYRTAPTSSEQFWQNGQRVIGIALSLPPNQHNIADAGNTIKQAIADINARFTDAPIKIDIFQPGWSQKRREGLVNSLIQSCIAICVVLLLFLSVQSAIVISLTVPAIVFSSLALFITFDGVIHQMTIAGLVLSLGLMVDNCIIVAERLSYLCSKGFTMRAALAHSVNELKKPLAAATMTTIAAFVPMLLAKGSVADFIATIPVLVIICILLSYIAALLLLPVLFVYFPISIPCLERWQETINQKLSTFGYQLAHKTLQHPVYTIVAATAMLCTLLSLPNANGKFFPNANRNQIYIDVQLPLASHIEATTKTANQIAEYALQYPEVSEAMVFSGFSGPRFYYNLAQKPNESHIARVVLTLQDNVNPPEFSRFIDSNLNKQFPEILINARELGQGPPIESPIELRLSGNDRNALFASAEAMLMHLRQHPKVTSPYRNYSLGAPTINLEAQQLTLSALGLSRSDVAEYIAWRSSGLKVTALDYHFEPIDLMIVDTTSNQSSTDILNTQIMLPNQLSIPLFAVLNAEVIGTPPFIERRDGKFVMSIKADVAMGSDEEEILEALQPTLLTIAQQHHVTLRFGGELEESEQANGALLQTLPFGVALLFGALMLQFNSYRLAILVMFTIPLGVVGAPAMLSIVGVPFGFMSILGVLALMGIVVNSAILLIEHTLEHLNQGTELSQAICLSVQTRLRPVIVTTLTTIVGMLPLTSSASPLWPPLAFAVIGGLLTSTLLTMLVLPLILKFLLSSKRFQKPQLEIENKEILIQ